MSVMRRRRSARLGEDAVSCANDSGWLAARHRRFDDAFDLVLFDMSLGITRRPASDLT
jgi:hypothetical protein